jgi:hypothetical protein
MLSFRTMQLSMLLKYALSLSASTKDRRNSVSVSII